MKEYKPGNCCKKCGVSGATSEYDNGWPDTKFMGIFGGPPDDFVPEETIKRTCQNCGYVWHDKPLKN